MIILRKYREISKLFAIRTPFPSDLEHEFSDIDPELDAEFGLPTIIVDQNSPDYRKQYNSSPETNREKCEKFIRQLKTNPESRFRDVDIEDSGEGDGTEYLAYKSRLTGPESDKFVTFSKNINREDRFTYRVYKPTVVTENGKRRFIQKIVLTGCLEHTVSGQPGAYVRGQRGNVWHPKKHSKRNRGKNK